MYRERTILPGDRIKNEKVMGMEIKNERNYGYGSLGCVRDKIMECEVFKKGIKVNLVIFVFMVVLGCFREKGSMQRSFEGASTPKSESRTGSKEVIPSTVSSITTGSIYFEDTDKIALGHSHTCAVKKDGSLWCWGNNNWGQLGLGNTTYTYSNTPQLVMSGGVREVALGGHHTCAIKKDGSLWCWGGNNHGQLGLEDKISRGKPARVLSGGIKEISFEWIPSDYFCIPLSIRECVQTNPDYPYYLTSNTDYPYYMFSDFPTPTTFAGKLYVETAKVYVINSVDEWNELCKNIPEYQNIINRLCRFFKADHPWN